MASDSKLTRRRGGTFFPTDNKADQIFYEVHPAGTARYHHSNQTFGDAHPDIANVILLHLEPSNVKGEDDVLIYWYGPATLADSIPRTSHEGGSYQQSKLYLKTGTPPAWNTLTGIPANVLYDGVSDGPAPGVLQDKFKMATYLFRDATVDKRAAWDDELGLAVNTVRTLMAVPVGGVPDAVVTASSTTSYDQSSENLMVRTVTSLAAGLPAYDGQVTPGTMDIEIPSLLTGCNPKFISAYAYKKEYIAYEEDLQLEFITTAPMRVAVPMTVTRRIFGTAGAASAYVAGLGQPYRMNPVVRDIHLATGYFYSGDNVFARANIRPIRTPLCLIPAPISVTIPAGAPEVSMGTGSDVGKTFTIAATSNPPWGTWVYWDTKPRPSRWGFFVVDVIHILLPLSPA